MKKKILITLAASILAFLSICLAWQGMHEVYKFEECDWASATGSFITAFWMLLILFKLIIFDLKD